MKNHWLEGMLEKGNITVPWNLKRVQLLNSLIKPTARFGADLFDHVDLPSMFGYGSIVDAHSKGSCSPNKVSAWVYVSLLEKAVKDANAVALLRSKSFSSQALNLWSSLFQTDVICQYIGEMSSEDPHLSCRYLIHSIIRSTVRRWLEFNETCKRLGKPAHYCPKEIECQKRVYREQIGEWKGDFKWTCQHNTFEEIARSTKSDMLFYRIANNEVHPTFGQFEALTDFTLPLPAIPLLPAYVAHGVGELQLEYQTAKLLANTTQRVTAYTTLPTQLQDRLNRLTKLQKEVLQELI